MGMGRMAFRDRSSSVLYRAGAVCGAALSESGITTIPELIGLRYDPQHGAWFSIAYILLYIVGTDSGYPSLRFAGI